MKTLLFTCLIFVSIMASAQSDKILSELAECKVTPETLTMAFNEDWENVSFERHSVSSSPGSDYVLNEIATYDAAKPAGSKWTLVSVNEKAPEKYYIKDFGKEKNSTKNKVVLTVDENSLQKADDMDNHAVYTFRYVEKSIPDNYSYLVDCISKAFINKSTNQLDKVEIVNEKPTKLSSLKIQELKYTIEYKFNTELNRYVVPRWESVTTGKFLGATATNKTVREYTKIK